MTDSDTHADSASAAAPPPAASTTARSPLLPVTHPWRGLFSLSLGLTLCALAVAESTGAANAPTWFLGFAIPVLTEWVGEWVVWGRKKTTA